MKRRSFMVGAGTLALSQLVEGCSSPSETLKVRLLKNSIPPQLLKEFTKGLGRKIGLDFAPDANLKDVYTNLQKWNGAGQDENGWRLKLPFYKPKVAVIPDLVTLGDYWLQGAIQQQLIQPLELAQLEGWKQLPPRWKELVTRNDKGLRDAKGKVWGAPYRWGSTVIIYRRDKFETLGWNPTDWGDLWKEELRDRISLLDQPREVIGLTLKKLGKSYNTPDLNKVSGLKDELSKLKGGVKFYSSDTYLQPLLLGDTWLAVGWSTDVLEAMKGDRSIAAVVPKSGTSLWADVWVRPTTANSSTDNLMKQWIDFCWEPDTASQISQFTKAASPAIASIERNKLPKDLQENKLLLPEAEVLDKSEFLYPLAQSTLEQYRSFWQEMQS